MAPTGQRVTFDLDAVADRLSAALGGRVERNVPFARLTTYGLGGPTAVLVRAVDEHDLAAVARALPPGVPFLCVGRGSNLLVADEGFAGVAVGLEGPLADLALPTPASGAPPGTILAGAGADAGVEERPVESLDLTYRHSNLGPAHMVIRAEVAVTARPAAECKAEIDEVVRWRRANQPGGNNAGSVFTNPPGDSAGRLIDACGLKGFRVGTAWVSERHANFFQAEPDGRGRAGDVVALVLEVQRQVEAATGVHLVPELRRVAFAGLAGARPGAPEAWPGEDHAATFAMGGTA